MRTLLGHGDRSRRIRRRRSHTIIDVKSESNLYDVLKLDHTILFPNQYTNYILGTHSTFSSFILWSFQTSIKPLYFLLHPSLIRDPRLDKTHTNFWISKISVPELPSNISSPEEAFQYSLSRVYLLISGMSWELTKSQERLQILFNCMVAQHQNFKLPMEPQAVSGSDIYPMLLPGIFSSQLIWLLISHLILILSI